MNPVATKVGNLACLSSQSDNCDHVLTMQGHLESDRKYTKGNSKLGQKRNGALQWVVSVGRNNTITIRVANEQITNWTNVLETQCSGASH